MKNTVASHTSQTDSFFYRFHSGEYQMLNGNGTDFDLTNIIDFDNGVPGFEELSKFIVVPLKEHPPFQVLQSLEAPPIAMFVIPIHHFESKQEIKIERADLAQIDTKSQDDTDIYFVMKIVSLKNGKKCSKFMGGAPGALIRWSLCYRCGLHHYRCGLHH